MRALVWQGRRKVSVETVPDPTIREPNDIVIEVTSAGLCGSDLHLYEVLGAFLKPGDILGHESMGRVVAVGSDIKHLKAGDRVVVPFNIACGHCFFCDRGLQTQCETTQVRESGMGAALFGYTELYGSVPGGQAQFLRVPQAHYGPVLVPDDGPDDRYLFLSDVAPTAWQGLEYSGVRTDETLLIVGLGPIGEMVARIALMRGIRVVGVESVPARIARSRSLGVEVLEIGHGPEDEQKIGDAVRGLTGGRGADGSVDAVGMEAHGSPGMEAAQKGVFLLPKAIEQKLMTTVSVDRMQAFLTAIDGVRRGGTVSLSGVYAGLLDPLPMQVLFDRQITIRMGQANVRRWMDDLLPLAMDPSDPLGFEAFATHHLPLEASPEAYETFQKKADGMIKTVFNP